VRRVRCNVRGAPLSQVHIQPLDVSSPARGRAAGQPPAGCPVKAHPTRRSGMRCAAPEPMRGKVHLTYLPNLVGNVRVCFTYLVG